MEPLKRHAQRRFFGMTRSQIGILAITGLFIIVIFGVAIVLVINNSSEEPTSADASHQIPAASAKVTSSPTRIVPATWPPTWTPASSPAAKSTTSPLKPLMTPIPVSIPTAAQSPQCVSLTKFINDTKPYVDKFQSIENHFVELAENFERTGNYLDPAELRSMANDLWSLAASTRIIVTTPELQNFRDSFVEGMNLRGDSLWDWAYGFELRVSPLNQQVAQAAQAKQTKALSIIGTTIATINSQRDRCQLGE